MMKHLLTGSALALLLAATPVIAQNSDTQEQKPAAEATQEQPAQSDQAAQSGETSGEAKTEQAQDSSSEAKTEQAQDGSSSDMKSSDTAQNEGEMKEEMKESDTAQSSEGTQTTTTTVEAEPAGSDASSMSQASGGMYVGEQSQDEILIGEWMGESVENAEGEKLGDINDVVVGAETGIKAVVIGVGGFLGIGEKDVAVNFDQIEQTRDENGDVTLILNTTKDQLEEAPKFVSLEDKEEASRQQAEMNQPATGTGNTMGTATTPTAPAATDQNQNMQEQNSGAQNTEQQPETKTQ